MKTLLQQVTEYMEDYWCTPDVIESLRERSEDELQKIRNTYIMTQPLPKPPYSNDVITKKNLPHPNHKTTGLSATNL